MLVLDFSKADDNEEVFDTLLKLQYLGDKLLPLTPTLEVNLQIIQKLQKTNDMFRGRDLCRESTFLQMENAIASYETRIRGHLTNLAMLEKKVNEHQNLVCLSNLICSENVSPGPLTT